MLAHPLKKVNKKFRNKPLEASVSKIDFIRFLKSAKIIDKSQRALYKNLEHIEKKKLIAYENRFLKFTKKGLKQAKEIEKDIDPYVRITKKLENKKLDLGSAQAYFK